MRVVTIIPTYNERQSLPLTLDRLRAAVPDSDVLVVDDNSPDDTVEVGKSLGIKHIIKHEKNTGYGGNQKSCYKKALEIGADIVIMLHPDYQYTPKLIHAMSSIIAYDVFPVVLASRILGKGALKGGMPMYKYIANRFLTLFENIMISQKLSEYHTGYRAFSAEVLRALDFSHNSDDFVFDNEMISQIVMKGYDIAEVTCPTKYFEEASSINFSRSMKYGRGVLRVSFVHWLHKLGIVKSKLYN